MQFCGIDWANDHHDAVSIDEAGRQLGSIRVAHSPEGLSQLDTYLERMAGPAGREQLACMPICWRKRGVLTSKTCADSAPTASRSRNSRP